MLAVPRKPELALSSKNSREFLCCASFGRMLQGVLTRRVHARVGLIGNPSDGFFGKTISVSISNFWAEVSIAESATLRLVACGEVEGAVRLELPQRTLVAAPIGELLGSLSLSHRCR